MILIPSKFRKILEKDGKHNGIVLKTLADFSEILAENQLAFFEEYTDHGIKHIQQVLIAAEELIDDLTFEKILTSKDVTLLVLSVILHDLGMHTSFFTFRNMISGKYDEFRIKEIDKKTWKELWDEYIDEAKKFNQVQKKSIFGNEEQFITNPEFLNKDELSGFDKKLIGEFIRRHHPRISHEISLNGLIGNDNTNIQFANELNREYKDIAGLIARSHGINVRDTFYYLQKFSEEEWAEPYNIHVVFLMIVLRIADYFQFDSSRISETTLKLKTFSSPISQLEHQKHLAIKFVKPSNKDAETLIVETNPTSSNIYIQLLNLFKDIQYEIDVSWAILGQIYGKLEFTKKPGLKVRRIKSNLDEPSTFKEKVNYVADLITLSADKEILKLLIAPLYGYNPSFGIRELLQNAIDACWERKILEKKKCNSDYLGCVSISFDIDENKRTYFQLKDDGKGMTIFEIKNYFLRAGSSYRNSFDWKKKFISSESKPLLHRNGKFGIGSLAAFLLGNEIEVETKSMIDNLGYKFVTKLDNESIEVTKDNNIEIGTRIKIYITDDVRNILLKEIKDRLNNTVKMESNFKKFRWDKWFVLNEPQVKIKVYNFEEFSPYTTPDPKSYCDYPKVWHELVTEQFDKIMWTYSTEFTSTSLSCNGIIIPDNYNFNNNFINKPFVSVFDYYGKLNLNLNRNSISGGRLPFQDELYMEIYKDLIKAILTYDIKNRIEGNNIYFTEQEIFMHPAVSNHDIYFCRSGFIVNLAPIVSVFSGQPIKQINFQNQTLNNAKISLKTQFSFLNKRVFELSTRAEKGFIEETLERPRSARKKNINLATPHYIQSIEETKIPPKNLSQNQRDFLSFAMKYFNNDFIIPFNIEERRIKYREAFEAFKLL